MNKDQMFEKLRVYFGTQQKMASELGLAQQTVNHWFVNKRLPYLRVYQVYHAIKESISIEDLSGGLFK